MCNTHHMQWETGTILHSKIFYGLKYNILECKNCCYRQLAHGLGAHSIMLSERLSTTYETITSSPNGVMGCNNHSHN